MAPAALSAAGDHHVDQMQFAAANCRIVSPQNLVGIGAVSQKTAKLKSLLDRIVRLRGWHGLIGTMLRKWRIPLSPEQDSCTTQSADCERELLKTSVDDT